MIKHPKIGCIDSYFYFVDELPVVEVNGLHGLSIHLVLKKQVGFGNGFASQVMKECCTAGMFTDEVNHQHTEQKDRCCCSGILECESRTYFHNFSDKMNPTPGFV